MLAAINNLSLIVPFDRLVRSNIRKSVKHFFSSHKSEPPVSLDTLDELAGSLIEKYGWDKSYKAFVMVCCGNEIWRPVVASVSYNRRMLLLPQCLRNSLLCKAHYDELGLLCSDCGNCNISEFLREAENLGYMTIVAEGTTIASQLTEGGNVDAIIGVSCLEVLQKMFSTVNKFGIPAIGIPLLTCGCKDTTADEEWIMEEIHNFDQHTEFKLLNLNNVSNKVTSIFKEEKLIKLLNLSGSSTDRLVLETMLAGGKRIRPLLTVLAYEAFSKQPDEETLEHLALSVECFHKASLIHDDIEDNDLSRYGKETVHIRYGIPVAINLGDLLIGEGYRLIACCNLEPHVIRECLKVVSLGHKALSTGQGTELMSRINNETLSLKDILTVFENKTAAAFRVSLLLGAIAGGADEQTLGVLDQFSYLIGLAYQIKDDLEDFTVENRIISFENPSIWISLLAEKVNGDIKQMRKALLQHDASELQNLMEKYMIPDSLTNLLKEYLHRIDLCLSNLHNIGLKLALHEIVGKTFNEYI
ncbi:MAG TPA: polyprenyl synthetase family protein [Bacteroidales bacterium]|nr:polyprenyl synthetase family protein [Bacteroidales bacterium]